MVKGDYHTHTIYSHGEGTILENAQYAKKRGLSEIAITDHAFGHSFYAIKRKDLSQIRTDIDEAQAKTGIKIYFGVEANFTTTQGDIDISGEDLKIFDVLLVGHHRFVKSSLKNKFAYFLPNIILGKYAPSCVKEKNTALTIKAMEKYPIDILVHMNYQAPVDVRQIAKKAKETKTIFELNENKIKFFSPADFDILIEEKVKLIINSDAHKLDEIGKFHSVLEAIEKYKIPKRQIVNWNKVPKFKKFST